MPRQSSMQCCALSLHLGQDIGTHGGGGQGHIYQSQLLARYMGGAICLELVWVLG